MKTKYRRLICLFDSIQIQSGSGSETKDKAFQIRKKLRNAQSTHYRQRHITRLTGINQQTHNTGCRYTKVNTVHPNEVFRRQNEKGQGRKKKNVEEKVRKRKDEGKTEVKNKIYIFTIGKMKATRSMRRKYWLSKEVEKIVITFGWGRLCVHMMIFTQIYGPPDNSLN
jgi:hypothetical protein